MRRVNECVDAVYVLTVKSFADRIAHMRAETARHGISFEFVLEHDAAELDPAVVESMFAPSRMRAAHQSLVAHQPVFLERLEVTPQGIRGEAEL